MASGVKEMKDENQHGATEQSKTPQPSEAPEMLERLKEPLNVNMLAKSSPSTLFCQEKVLSSCHGRSFLAQEGSARPVESRSHGKQRLMKDGSGLGFWRGECLI